MQGVYKIENTKNGKKYIGSSKDMEKRFYQHKRDLNLGRHHSVKLQNAWNKVADKSVFVFQVVEDVECLDDLKVREQYYIDLYDTYYSGYNCSLKVDNPLYARKSLSKKQKREAVVKLQKEFVSLYDPLRVEMRAWNPNRFISGDYKYSTYKIALCCIRWFLQTYPEPDYKVIINKSEYSEVRGHCLWICYGEQDFAMYRYCGGKIVLDSDYTDKMIKHLKVRGVYDGVHYQLRGGIK